MLNRWVIVYIDDILIYSDSHEWHMQHVRAVRKHFKDHHLYAKLEKCEFNQTSVAFLGYVIGSEGVLMDEISKCCIELATMRHHKWTTKISGIFSFLPSIH